MKKLDSGIYLYLLVISLLLSCTVKTPNQETPLDAMLDMIDQKNSSTLFDYQVEDQSPSTALLPCVTDEACAIHEYCALSNSAIWEDLVYRDLNIEFYCQPQKSLDLTDLALEEKSVVMYAGRFELLPKKSNGMLGFEPWTKHCDQQNRYQGLLTKDTATMPSLETTCSDDFDDVDGDGLFDALWLGGTTLSRAVKTVDEALLPEGRLLAWMDHSKELYLFIVLDTYGLDRMDQLWMSERLNQEWGIKKENIFWHTNNMLNVPDLTGFFGPSIMLVKEFNQIMSMESALNLKLLEDLPLFSNAYDALLLFILKQVSQQLDQIHQNPKLLQKVKAIYQSHPNPFEWQPPLDFSIDQSLGFMIPDMNANMQGNELEDFTAFYQRDEMLFQRRSFPYHIDPSLKVIQWQNSENQQVVATMYSMGIREQESKENQMSTGFIGISRKEIEAQSLAPAIFLTASSSEDSVLSKQIPIFDPLGQAIHPNLISQKPEEEFGQALASIVLQLLSPNNRFQLTPKEMAINFSVTHKPIWLSLSNPRLSLLSYLKLNGLLNAHVDRRDGSDTYIEHDLVQIQWFDQNTAQADQMREEGEDYISGQYEGLTWFLTPANIDSSLLAGQKSFELNLASKYRPFKDLDADGILDKNDSDIIYTATSHYTEYTKVLNSIDPQRFYKTDPVTSEDRWFIGGVNGGFGTMQTQKSAIPVFEGLIDTLIEKLESNQQQIIEGLQGLGIQSFTVQQKPEKLIQIPLLTSYLQAQADAWLNIQNHHSLIINIDHLKRSERSNPISSQNNNGGMDNGGMDNGGMDNGGMDNGGMDNGGMDNGGTEIGSADTANAQDEDLLLQLDQSLNIALSHADQTTITIPAQHWKIIDSRSGQVIYDGIDELLIEQISGQYRAYSLQSDFYKTRLNFNQHILWFEYGTQPIQAYEISLVSHAKLNLLDHPNHFSAWSSPYYQQAAFIYNELCTWIYQSACNQIIDF